MEISISNYENEKVASFINVVDTFEAKERKNLVQLLVVTNIIKNDIQYYAKYEDGTKERIGPTLKAALFVMRNIVDQH